MKQESGYDLKVLKGHINTALIRNRGTSEPDSNVVLSTLSKKGEVRFLGTGVCHGRLNSGYAHIKEINSLEAIINNIQPSKRGLHDVTQFEKDRELFLEWLLNHSLWRSTFISKNYTEALKHKILLSDPDTPSNLMVSGMIAIRSVSENSHRSVTWAKLVRYGVDPILALLAAIRLVPTYAANMKEEGLSLIHKYDHIPLPNHMGSAKVMSNILREKPMNLSPSYNSTLSYGPILRMWGDGWFDDDEVDPLKQIIEKCFVYKKKKSSLNPFKVDENRDYALYEESLENISKTLKDEYGNLKGA